MAILLNLTELVFTYTTLYLLVRRIIELTHPEYFKPWIFFHYVIHLSVHFLTYFRVIIVA